MKYIPIIILFTLSLPFAVSVSAEEASTFAEARALSAEKGKPILMEFVRED